MKAFWSSLRWRLRTLLETAGFLAKPKPTPRMIRALDLANQHKGPAKMGPKKKKPY